MRPSRLMALSWLLSVGHTNAAPPATYRPVSVQNVTVTTPVSLPNGASGTRLTVTTFDAVGRELTAFGDLSMTTVFIDSEPCRLIFSGGTRYWCITARVSHPSSAELWGPVTYEPGEVLTPATVQEWRLIAQKKGQAFLLKSVPVLAPAEAKDWRELSALVQRLPSSKR